MVQLRGQKRVRPIGAAIGSREGAVAPRAGGTAASGGIGVAANGKYKVPSVEDVLRCIEAKKLFIKNLPGEGLSKEEVAEIFEGYGEIEDIVVPKKKPSVRFVVFGTWAAAQRALRGADGLRLPGHSPTEALSVEFSRSREGRKVASADQFVKGLDLCRVFVGCLPDDVDEDDLWGLADSYGKVVDVKLLPKRGNRGGAAFVDYSMWGEAMDAIEGLDGMDPSGGDADRLEACLAKKQANDQPHSVSAPVAEPPAKRPRFQPPPGYEGGGGGEAVSAARPQPTSTPTVGRPTLQFKRLRADYLRALEDGSDREVCDRLHERLMAARPRPKGGATREEQDNPRPSVWNHLGAPDDAPSERSRSAPRKSRSRSASRSVSRDRSRSRDEGGARPRAADACRNEAADEDEEARLFIRGLPKGCHDEELDHLVSQLDLGPVGEADREVLECRVLPNKGCGYVTFASRVAAEEALHELHDRQVKGWNKVLAACWAEPPRGNGRKAAPRRANDQDANSKPRTAAPRATAQRPTEPSQRSTIFVGQLQKMVSAGDRDREDFEDRLWQQFERFGRTVKRRYLADKGIAFVSFSRESDAASALHDMNGRVVHGLSRGDSGLRVQYSNEESKK